MQRLAQPLPLDRRVTRPSASPAARAWLVVGLLSFVGCLNYLDRNMITTMRLSLIASIPMSDAKFALLLSTFLWTYAILSPFGGFVADRFGRSRVIVGSLFVWSLTTWLTAAAHTYGELLATRVLMGISEAAYLPAAVALIADYHPSRTRAMATGIHMAGVMIGAGLGGVGGWMAANHTWHYPFGVFGVVGTVYAVILAILLRDLAPSGASAPEPIDSVPEGGMWQSVSSLLREPSYLRCLGFFGIMGVLGWGLTGWLPTYFHERYHLGAGEAGLSATGFLNAGSFTGVLLGGFLGDKAAHRHPRGRVWLVGSGLLVAALGVVVLSQAQVLWLAVAGVVTYGVTRTFTDSNMMPILCTIAPRRQRATGYGLLNLVANTVGGLGNFAAGALRDAKVDLGAIFLAMVGVLLVAAFLVLRVRPSVRVSKYEL